MGLRPLQNRAFVHVHGVGNKQFGFISSLIDATQKKNVKRCKPLTTLSLCGLQLKFFRQYWNGFSIEWKNIAQCRNTRVIQIECNNFRLTLVLAGHYL
jgi:hypothetical protein